MASFAASLLCQGCTKVSSVAEWSSLVILAIHSASLTRKSFHSSFDMIPVLTIVF